MKKSNHSTRRTSRNDIPGNSRNIENYYKSYANSIQGNIASAQQLLKNPMSTTYPNKGWTKGSAR